MIKIDFPEPTTVELHSWREKCNEVTQALIANVAQGNEPEVSDLYKGQQDVYKSHNGAFHGKCAYCEANIAADQPGDIEHFRPKGGLTDADNHPVKVEGSDGGERVHPGYYWLAYEWQNLLPACADCNRPSRRKSVDGRLLGKWDRFPINGTYAATPDDDLVQEDPLLINPVFENPADHLEIDETGLFTPLNDSDRGRMCISIFGLNDRGGLVEERKRTFNRVSKTISLARISHR